MNLTSRKVLKNLLKKYRIRPSKRFGQNFLIDKRVIKKILEAAVLELKGVVLEIGPGIGNITQELAKKVKKIIAIEKDPKMIEILEETLKGFKNVKITRADILKINIKSCRLKAKNYKVVGNLPFYLTAPVIRKFLESKNPPNQMILLVQKEVAQRICAKPPKMNLLAVSVQFYAKPKIIFYVSKKSFWPQPKVDGAIIKISQICPNLPRIDTNLFFKIVKAGFSQPRKQIANNLSKKLKLGKEKIKNWLLENELEPNQRAETLSIQDWINLTKSLPKLKLFTIE